MNKEMHKLKKSIDHFFEPDTKSLIISDAYLKRNKNKTKKSMKLDRSTWELVFKNEVKKTIYNYDIETDKLERDKVPGTNADKEKVLKTFFELVDLASKQKADFFIERY